MDLEVGNEVSAGEASSTAVFVVDDEPMFLELAKLLLEPHGFAVSCFRDPGSALEAYAAAAVKPKVVITDYAMHTMNGLQFMKACRKISPGQKVLMVSGTVSEAFIRQSPALPDSFLEKPFHSEQLIAAVRELLSQC